MSARETATLDDALSSLFRQVLALPKKPRRVVAAWLCAAADNCEREGYGLMAYFLRTSAGEISSGHSRMLDYLGDADRVAETIRSLTEQP